ncbi:hypothetical protein HK097_000677 [Rhizophlyctis rosea]|uniref:IgA peptidase M64-domain-containing protein n=1 Tax=Rhizophlyctis rosea TaxID=64517 RepID=A0AAD5X1U9_9FUNG|nr:hypothetical protein HK097_000677 [Rhizophlyctis rosea]
MHLLALQSLLLFLPLSQAHTQQPLISAPSPPTTSTTLPHRITLLKQLQTCTILSSLPTTYRPFPTAPLIHRSAAIREEPSKQLASSEDEVIEIVGPDEESCLSVVQQVCGGRVEMLGDGVGDALVGEEDLEIVKIVDGGKPKNRIDVVFMGDGYTNSERDKFFSDVRRLTSDMFNGTTFASTLPLFNIWAVYKPSKETGIGVGGIPKDTAFGLYRDGTELRGIYCSKASYARRLCHTHLPPSACDYPSLIGNDDYYGGLGGEFVISTSSKTSGTVVLRHEMGHNFVSVGEEYDGGQVYEGVNSSPSLWGLKWRHWMEEGERVREERAVLRVQDYSWYDLAKGAYRISFRSDGFWKKWFMQISASGVEVDGAMEVYLDGKPLSWHTTGNLDRGFHRWYREERLTAGQHELVFKSGVPPKVGAPIRQLCSVTLHETMGEDLYRWNNSVISAYPVWSLYGRKKYRPTNEGCLMRNMSSEAFCSVCKEGLWQNLLSKISLIDEITISHTPATSSFLSLFSRNEKKKTQVSVTTLPLAQFRVGSKIEGEEFLVRWYVGGREREELRGQWSVEVEDGEGKGNGKWEVDVEFVTREVRKDLRGVMKERRRVDV